MIAEAESYVGTYDIFSDVLPGSSAGPHRFGTGRGIDLRVPVYEAEGIDPLRAVFLLRVYDSSLEEAAGDDWKRAATDPGFYRDILVPRDRPRGHRPRSPGSGHGRRFRHDGTRRLAPAVAA